jgi:hypothetical protein
MSPFRRMAATRPALAALALACALAGCGTGDDERSASEVVERFQTAIGQRDGEAACAELTETAASTLEDQEQSPCDEAILSLDLPAGGSVADVRVYVTSAVVDRAGGGTAFLDETPDGWRISAAGCMPDQPGHPYECELEG